MLHLIFSVNSSEDQFHVSNSSVLFSEKIPITVTKLLIIMEPLKNEKYDIMNNIVEDIYKDSVKLNSQEKVALVKRVNNVS